MSIGRQRIAVVGLSFLVLAFTLAGKLVSSEEQREQTYRDLETFTEVLELVNTSYVDTVAEEQLMSGAFRGMLASLDPKSGWLSPAEVEDLLDDDRRRLSAGIETTKRSGYAYVASVRAGSPGDLAGVKAGEYIRTINGRSTRELSVFQVRRALSGPPDTRLSLNLFGGREGRTVRVTLAPFESTPVSVEPRPGGVLLLTVHYLAPATVDATRQALQQPPAGTRHVLLDLRDTVGGERADGVGLADLFLSEGAIVRLEERGSEPVMVEAGSEVVWTGPLSLLVNRMSAGTVEIAVAALQDRGRAEVLGEPTFGDATLQRLIRLPDDSAVILSVGRYLAPDGTTWADHGIEPDVSIPASAGRRGADDDGPDDQLEKALEHVAPGESAMKPAA